MMRPEKSILTHITRRTAIMAVWFHLPPSDGDTDIALQPAQEFDAQIHRRRQRTMRAQGRENQTVIALGV
jgi:hypothetical protein